MDRIHASARLVFTVKTVRSSILVGPCHASTAEVAHRMRVTRTGDASVLHCIQVSSVQQKGDVSSITLSLGSHCETKLLRCSSKPCRTGSCTDLPGNSYQCRCPDGITGVNCDVPVLPCDSNPCMNNSTCLTLSMNNYTCVCPPAYMGARCSERRSLCSENACQGNATCVVDKKTGEDTCQCPNGRYGIQ